MSNLLKKLFGGVRLQKDIVKHDDSEVKVIGIGGCGGNVVSYLYSNYGDDVDCIYCDRDTQALNGSVVPMKIVLKESIEENKDVLRTILSQKVKVVFLVAGTGGDIGSAIPQLIVKMCQETDIKIVLIAVTPFKSEGTRKIDHAFDAIKQMAGEVEMAVIFSNHHILSKYGNLNIADAFDKCSKSISEAILNITKAYRSRTF